MGNELSVVGKRIPMVRWFASEKVTGKAKFTVDMKLPGMLHAKMVRSPYPHARVLKVDTSKAEKLPGSKRSCPRTICGEYVGDRFWTIGTSSTKRCDS